MQNIRKVTNNHQEKMLRFERQQKSLLMEMKEMKSMINEVKYIMGSNDIDEDVKDVDQNIIALNNTTVELESMGQALISKQHKASNELNLAIKKLTHIAMKYNSSSTQRTTSKHNRESENVMMMGEDNKTEAENLKRRVIELEEQLCDKRAMELEMEQLREALDVTKRLGCDQNIEMKKEIEELKGKLKESKNLQSRINLLDGQKALELENEQLKETLNTTKNMCGGCDDEKKKEINELSRKLREKEELLEGQEAVNKVLNEKELSINNELREARKELILGLRGMSSSLIIGVKAMGELDLKPFLDASSKLECPAEEALTRSIQLCWKWREQIKDPNWHPFKISKVGDKNQEIVDEEDEKLNGLKEELGEEVCKAVTTAVMEMNKFKKFGTSRRERKQL